MKRAVALTVCAGLAIAVLAGGTLGQSGSSNTVKAEQAPAAVSKQEEKPAAVAQQKPKKKKDKAPEVVKKEGPKFNGKERTFLLTYSGAVKDLKPGQKAEIWLPAPTDTDEQQIEIVTKTLPENGSFHTEKQYGNKMLHFAGTANEAGKIPFEIAYRVTRKEVKTNFKANLTLKPRPDEPLGRFLEPDKLVPISGKPLDLIKDTKLPGDQFAAAKVLYDVVNTHMKYDKSGKGWGRGDSEWACDSKFGNCTDFHSLFISMARGNKIPSKFEMGFPVPPKRGNGPIGGYHCWAWFMPEGKGWIPVDISEANRFPQMKDYYFGNLTEDRVQFTTGRDINLEPRQKGPALNFFIYPYVEVDGQPYALEKVDRSYAYQDVK
ncbi:MAG: transglutaminase domain-containing protein [Gemmataceae bacterium]|nr:transglutaminase domain-containing protein [Gemmataceae bacterium]